MDQLRAEGYSRRQARQRVEDLEDETIDEYAVETYEKTGHPPVGGPFLDWIKQHGPAILEIVKKLLPLLLMFPAQKGVKPEGDSDD